MIEIYLDYPKIDLKRDGARITILVLSIFNSNPQGYDTSHALLLVLKSFFHFNLNQIEVKKDYQITL